MKNYEIKYNINADDYMLIREEIGWNKLNIDQVKKALNNSMINISVYVDNQCAGIGRIVGDNVLKGMLTDIMVHPKYQKKGIGKIIVTKLIESLDKIVNIGESFQLEASPTKGNREFYIKCGLKYKPENQDGVYLWIRK